MRLAIRNKLTNELLAIVLEDLPEGLDDNGIQNWIESAPGLDDQTIQLLENEDMYLSYEEDTGSWY